MLPIIITSYAFEALLGNFAAGLVGTSPETPLRSSASALANVDCAYSTSVASGVAVLIGAWTNATTAGSVELEVFTSGAFTAASATAVGTKATGWRQDLAISSASFLP